MWASPWFNSVKSHTAMKSVYYQMETLISIMDRRGAWFPEFITRFSTPLFLFRTLKCSFADNLGLDAGTCKLSINLNQIRMLIYKNI